MKLIFYPPKLLPILSPRKYVELGSIYPSKTEVGIFWAKMLTPEYRSKLRVGPTSCLCRAINTHRTNINDRWFGIYRSSRLRWCPQTYHGDQYWWSYEVL